MIYQEPPARLDSCWNWQTCFFIRIWSVSQLRMLIGTNFSCWEKGRTRCPDRQAAQTLQFTIMNSAERKKIRGKKRPTDGKKLTLVNSKLSLHAEVLTDTWHRLMWLYTDKPTKWPADCCNSTILLQWGAAICLPLVTCHHTCQSFPSLHLSLPHFMPTCS